VSTSRRLRRRIESPAKYVFKQPIGGSQRD
jgi:hypothetical protein